MILIKNVAKMLEVENIAKVAKGKTAKTGQKVRKAKVPTAGAPFLQLMRTTGWRTTGAGAPEVHQMSMMLSLKKEKTRRSQNTNARCK